MDGGSGRKWIRCGACRLLTRDGTDGRREGGRSPAENGRKEEMGCRGVVEGMMGWMRLDVKLSRMETGGGAWASRGGAWASRGGAWASGGGVARGRSRAARECTGKLSRTKGSWICSPSKIQGSGPHSSTSWAAKWCIILARGRLARA
jgi:hypothetical protein